MQCSKFIPHWALHGLEVTKVKTLGQSRALTKPGQVTLDLTFCSSVLPERGQSTTYPGKTMSLAPHWLVLNPLLRHYRTESTGRASRRNTCEEIHKLRTVLEEGDLKGLFHYKKAGKKEVFTLPGGAIIVAAPKNQKQTK